MPQYSGVWSLQQQMQALTSGQWATDPLFDYTTLLLQGDAGANGAQNNTFYDTSPNQFAITRNGNTTQGSFSPFSATGWGNYFNGSSSLDTSSTAVSNFGTGAYTVEFWIYLSSYSAGVVPFIWGCPAVAGPPQFNINSNGTLALAASGGSTVFTSTSTLPLNTWTHVALVRTSTSSNGLTCYFNGVAGGTGTDATNWSATQSFRIATSSSGGSDWSMTGYLSNFRVCKAAVYTSNFTPSTVALTTTSQGASSCVLLACQNNRFLDNSSTASTFTVTGTPSVQPFSPFAPQYQWTSDVIGGSGYFDGTGDFLQLASPTSAVAPGSGDFTFSVWIYPTAFTSPVAGILDIANAGNATRFGVILYANGKIYVDNNTNLLISANAVPLNAWTYVSVVRSGSTMTIYYNGVSQASGTVTQNFTDTTTYIGRSFDGYHFQGYMSGMRLVKGSALAATTPTAPLTAVTNTSLLLNFTNAGIYDGTMKNCLETVGNAQISTSVVKYGSGSLYFDGSGDGLVSPISKLFDFGSGNFTVEFWANCVSTSGQGYFVSVWEDSGGSDSNSSWLIRLNSGTIITHFMQGGATYNTLTSPTISTNTWFHFAWVRNGNTQTMYINGTAVATGSVSGAMNSVIRQFRVGYQGAATNYLNGYLDDLRITNGFARYTQNFIPPSVALPRQ